MNEIRGRMMIQWTDEQTNMLRQLICCDGVSFAVAAERLVKVFPEMAGITRNACIGRASREDIRSPNDRGSHSQAKKVCKARERPPVATPRDEIQQRLDAHHANVARIFADKEPDIDIPVESTGFSLIDAFNERKPDQCKWPHGDAKNGTFRYCCHPVQTHIPGLPYCNAHQLVACREDRRTAVRKKQQAFMGVLEAAE